MKKGYSLTTKNQVTVPKQVRDEMGLTSDDGILFVKDEETGRYYLQKAASVESVVAQNQKHLKEKDIKPASDKQLRRARRKYYEDRANS